MTQVLAESVLFFETVIVLSTGIICGLDRLNWTGYCKIQGHLREAVKKTMTRGPSFMLFALFVAILSASFYYLDPGFQTSHKYLIELSSMTGIGSYIQNWFHAQKTAPQTGGKSTKPVVPLKLYTNEDLKLKDGEDQLRLVILGHVFDVSGGRGMYSYPSGYHGFIGQDATRAYITGEFDEKGLTSDIDGLDLASYKSLHEWLGFYLNHKTYVHLGYHIGRFFDDKGQETAYMKQFQNWLEAAKQEDLKKESIKAEYPPCNVKWTQENGGVVWCTPNSGGVARSWIGFPRRFFDGNSERCACIPSDRLNDPKLRLYKGCLPTAEKCHRTK